MNDQQFLIEDPELDAVALEFLAAQASAGQALEAEGAGDRFDRFTGRMADALVRLARLLGVGSGFFVSATGQVRVMGVEQASIDGVLRGRVVSLPAHARPALDGLARVTAPHGLAPGHVGQAPVARRVCCAGFSSRGTLRAGRRRRPHPHDPGASAGR
jgi:hypothetical protein